MQSLIHASISDHLGQLPEQFLKLLSAEFSSSHIVAITDLLPSHLKTAFHEEAARLLQQDAKRRDLTIDSTGGTPRHYQSVGRDVIKEHGTVIPAVFTSPDILAFLAQIADEPLHRVPYEPEEYILNSQNQTGDTHGWHWDDYTYALIWIVEAPDPLSGGRIEYVPQTQWDKDAPRDALNSILQTREVRSRYVEAGTCYLMKASTTLHRIAPLTSNTRRTVVVYTFASEADLSDETISHETMEAIYNAEIPTIAAE
ncbi:HalD/BesD family halogenase [Cohaesibacter celericrescens]|uniref:Fe2OG dioxygenase domain-containing protein n=1 Tax=Cohaesibacter celericrescens TaxID=2067669 RepID=A0A2N5XKG8_9HYPH|nr:hypothetical protein [Cohaesibacter celericrescens]PLW74927.1 hypothetical protein C0081_21705 [Cohaesibacter celericrescens]